jgi:hypothetical protein
LPILSIFGWNWPQKKAQRKFYPYGNVKGACNQTQSKKASMNIFLVISSCWVLWVVMLGVNKGYWVLFGVVVGISGLFVLE